LKGPFFLKAAAIAAGALFLLLIASYNSTLFHNIAEIFGIVIAGGIFMITWNARRHFENNYLLFIGIAYLFIGITAFVHLETFRGTNEELSNTGLQVMTIADLAYGLSFLLAPFLMGKRIRAFTVLACYSAIAGALLASIFVWDIFPACYVPGEGKTPFKAGVEYAGQLFLIASLILLYKKRGEFEPKVFVLLFGSIAVAFITELSILPLSESSVFTGRHFLELISSYLVYGAIISTGFERPYKTLFKDLADKEEAIRRARDGLEARIKERTEELVRLTERLQSEIDEHALAEDELKERTLDLNERVRELNALYSLGNVFGRRGISISEMFDALSDMLPLAFKDPESVCVRLIYKGAEFKTCNFRETPRRRSADIYVHGKKEGSIEVFCLHESANSPECSLLNTRENLLKALGRQVGETLERREAEEALLARERQQATVAALGRNALSGMDVHELMDRALQSIKETLGVEECRVWEFSPEKSAMFGSVSNIRARGIMGINDGKVGNEGCPDGDHSGPLFSTMPLFPEDSVLSSAKVLIKGPERPFGVIGVYSRSPRTFSADDMHFLQAVSNVLAEAIERREAESEKTRLVAAIESTADAVIIMDPRGAVTYANPAFERITGYRREEVIGRDLFEISQLVSVGGRFSKKILAEGLWIGRSAGKRKDGATYQEESTIAPIRGAEGRVISYVMVKRDITEKLRLESIAEAVNTMDNIGYIFSGIRHEIGNPVNSIKMALQVLRSRLGDCPRKTIEEYIDRSITEITRMEYLLKALKNFNMYESPEIKRIDLAGFMKEFLSLIGPDFGKKGIKIIRAPISEGESAYADPRALQQVLLNIITNAADALEGRKDPEIKIEVARSGHMMSLKVEDNGYGMTGSQLKELFIPFHTTKPHGTGLGLVLVKKMLARMKSTINITSEQGRGTVAEISIPAGNHVKN